MPQVNIPSGIGSPITGSILELNVNPAPQLWTSKVANSFAGVNFPMPFTPVQLAAENLSTT